MNYAKLNNFLIDDSIKDALKEDINYLDISATSIFRENKEAAVDLRVKEDGIICGLDVFKRVYKMVDPEVTFIDFKNEGDRVFKGDKILEVRGRVLSLLTGERVAINYMGFMSGIATATSNLVEKLNDENIKILDTRKTAPNLRVFQKYAVLTGGGFNHRYNLSDMVMLKDNHISAAGSITEAVNMVRERDPYIKKIEVEVENLDMLREALDSEVDIIMLDNMDIPEIEKACEIVNGKAVIEVSGNVTMENIEKYRGLKIDYLSSGALTHSYKVLDLSMKNLRYINEGENQ